MPQVMLPSIELLRRNDILNQILQQRDSLSLPKSSAINSQPKTPFDSVFQITNNIVILDNRVYLPTNTVTKTTFVQQGRRVWLNPAMHMNNLLHAYAKTIPNPTIIEQLKYVCDFLDEPPTSPQTRTTELLKKIPSHCIITPQKITPLVSSRFGTISHNNRVYSESIAEVQRWNEILCCTKSAQKQSEMYKTEVLNSKPFEYTVSRFIPKSRMKTPKGTFVFDPVFLEMEVRADIASVAIQTFPRVHEGYNHFCVFLGGDICYNGTGRFDKIGVSLYKQYPITPQNLKKIGLVFAEGQRVLTQGYKTGNRLVQSPETLERYLANPVEHRNLKEYVCI